MGTASKAVSLDLSEPSVIDSMGCSDPERTFDGLLA